MKTIVKEMVYMEFTDFEKFLIEQNVYDLYAKYTAHEKHTLDIKGWVLRQSPYDVFRAAFVWMDTAEGVSYWSSISEMWEVLFSKGADKTTWGDNAY